MFPTALLFKVGGNNLKKVIKSFVIVITLIFLLSPFCFAETDFKEQIKSEDGSLFEKIIAECIRWYCPDSF